MTQDVKEAIVHSQSLKELSFSCFPFTLLSARDDWWIRVANESRLQTILFPVASDQRTRFQEQFVRYPKVLNLIKFK